MFCGSAPLLDSQLSLRLPSILQVSDLPSADEWQGVWTEEWRGKRGRGGVKKKERKQNNWFCRHLERVQTGQRELPSVNAAQGNPTRSHLIEKVAFWVNGCSRQRQRERDTKRVASYRNACRDVSPKCVFTHYLLSVLLSKLLWFSPFRIRFRFNCALREKCFYERIIWLIKDMNKRSYKPSVCFFLRCSQLGSNGRIKGVFVWPPL